MIYTTKQTKKNISKKFLKIVLVAIFWILIWEIASRIVSRNNELLLLIFPSPFTVFKKWLSIAFTGPFLQSVLHTLIRIFLGFVIGVLAGFFIGIMTHISEITYLLLSPILKIIRAVPVVAIIILLYLFFNSTTMPIIIVFLMVMPLIWQTVHDGLSNTEKPLLEMAKTYQLTNKKTLFKVKLPTLKQPLITACVNALGLAWKSGIAAEVLCLPGVSLGTMLWQSKGNVNYDEVYALTITVVLLSLIFEYLFKFLCKKYLIMNGGIKND